MPYHSHILTFLSLEFFRPDHRERERERVLVPSSKNLERGFEQSWFLDDGHWVLLTFLMEGNIILQHLNVMDNLHKCISHDGSTSF